MFQLYMFESRIRCKHDDVQLTFGKSPLENVNAKALSFHCYAPNTKCLGRII